MARRLSRPSAALLLALAAGQAWGYVTSAVLEFSTDDKAGFHLNGNVVLAKSDYHPFDFGALSTSDGTLPMHFFNMNGDNVLAVENFDTEGGHMGVAYRLTVHHSAGDPVIIWSEPGASKFLHLRSDQKAPEGWTSPDFDDSKWETATEGYLSEASQWVTWPKLPDPFFDSVFGGGTVPYVCHSPSGLANGGDHNLLRSHFRFPNTPEKMRTLLSQVTAQKGQKVAVRLAPGREAAYFDAFQIFARIPQGLKLAGASSGGFLDQRTSTLVWEYKDALKNVGYAKLGAASVLGASGWSRPEKVLGQFKEGKGQRQLNTPKHIYDDGATFTPGNAAWFKMDAPPYKDGPGAPAILGVIFRSQVRAGGRDDFKSVNVDPLFINYSVDGSMNALLKEDAAYNHATVEDRWTDAYYDATEDRKWTWADLSKLQVRLEARQIRARDVGRIASLVATVKYFNPNSYSPYFYVEVDESGCKDFAIQSGLRQPRDKASITDPLPLAVNPGACPPTPVPTPTPWPTNTPMIVYAPTPEPTKAATALPIPTIPPNSTEKIRLGCLQNLPEPFKRGGTYIYFCLNSPAKVELLVYRTPDGALLRQEELGEFRAGDNQAFYGGLDGKGKTLKPGTYLYEIRAKGLKGGVESRNSQFHRVKD